jgi:hypothetical protein
LLAYIINAAITPPNSKPGRARKGETMNRYYIYSNNNSFQGEVEAKTGIEAARFFAGENRIYTECPEESRIDLDPEGKDSLWAEPAPPVAAERAVQLFLDATGQHLAAHDTSPNGYLYLNPNGFDYNGYLSSPVSVENAFRWGFLRLSDFGVDVCGNTVPLAYDFAKIRRRVEDALRKTADHRVLIEVAVKLGCRID